jgi:predicted ATPase
VGRQTYYGVSELVLTSFKSFRNARMPLDNLTLLVGRNGSGKSNALDGLDVLARLATGEDIREALDGGSREAGSVRGGLEGCVPRGSSTFALGAVISDGAEVTLDVEIQLEPQVQIVYERLTGPTSNGPRTLLETSDPDPHRGDIDATWWNGRRGRNPTLPFRASRLLTAQVFTRVPDTTDAGRAVHRAAGLIIAALRGVFHLDPVPHLMRQYVPERDVVLRRTAENLSAVVGHLRQDAPEAFATLLELARALPEQEIVDLLVERSPLGDVMLAMVERQNGRDIVLPVRLMSDGMLRFLAIATALLSSRQALDRDPADTAGIRGARTLVIEELENGLHPTQAAKVLDLLVHRRRYGPVFTVATTHSPALLSALDGSFHDGVLVVDRDPQTGLSRLRPLPELPGYPTAMAAGSLGEVVTRGLLTGGAADRDYSEFDRLLGIA